MLLVKNKETYNYLKIRYLTNKINHIGIIKIVNSTFSAICNLMYR
nr:MAG TPA: hypothetical protein [Caudoviricetes sp.]